ncbi:Monocarboxylate transporter 9, partial [Eumeta japonica]
QHQGPTRDFESSRILNFDLGPTLNSNLNPAFNFVLCPVVNLQSGHCFALDNAEGKWSISKATRTFSNDPVLSCAGLKSRSEDEYMRFMLRMAVVCRGSILQFDLSYIFNFGSSFVSRFCPLLDEVRIVIGWVGDWECVNASLVYAGCMLLCGLITGLLPFLTSYAWLGAAAGGFGAFIAANYSLTSIILVELITLEKFTNAYGLLLLIQGLANLVGPPLAEYNKKALMCNRDGEKNRDCEERECQNGRCSSPKPLCSVKVQFMRCVFDTAGWLYDVTASYDLSFWLAGVFIGLSGLMMCVLPAHRRLCRGRERRSAPDPANGHLNFNGKLPV